MTVDPVVRRATSDDLLAVMRCFDGGLLETDTDRIKRWLDTSDTTEVSDGFVLVVTLTERPVGAVAVATDVANTVTPPEHQCIHNSGLPPAHITAIAVRPSRQNRGLGRLLLTQITERVAPRPLSATFEDRVAPFYAACGFEIHQYNGRLWGICCPSVR